MILPIVAYGAPILRAQCRDIEPDYPDLKWLIADMWETLDFIGGAGLAAPQVNRDIRLFIVDSRSTFHEMPSEMRLSFPDNPGIRQVFINARVTGYSGVSCSEEEGCLSFPGLWENIQRLESVTLSWMDEQFQPHVATFHGPTARMIQHEYDHIEGKLFIDYLTPLRRRLLQRRLDRIAAGTIETPYPMFWP